MKNKTNKERHKMLKAIVALPDNQIDTIDIPELSDEQLRRAVRGRMFRPIKKQVSNIKKTSHRLEGRFLLYKVYLRIDLR